MGIFKNFVIHCFRLQRLRLRKFREITLTFSMGVRCNNDIFDNDNILKNFDKYVKYIKSISLK